jgi:SPP1 family predicted phage head-tail adaptor
MNAGYLDRKIVIEQQSTTRDDFGGENITWATYKTIWAGIAYKRTTEKTESEQTVASRVVEFTIRALDAPLVDESMRISYDSQIFEIEGVLKHGRNDKTILMTKVKI